MQEILFRGKKWDNSEWVFGDLIKSKSGDAYILPIDEEDLTENIMVIPETVGQYIGWDDANQQKLYVGDKIEIGWHNEHTTCETVTYDDYYGYFKYGNNPLCELKDPIRSFVIVGNIHEL
jgi:hypothetical protein